jgi:hypothetical protein
MKNIIKIKIYSNSEFERNMNRQKLNLTWDILIPELKGVGMDPHGPWEAFHEIW